MNTVLDVFTTSTTSRKSLTTAIAQSNTSFTISTSEASNDTEKVDNPNEYRDLLISLSGQKSDHILWIECLKQYQWEGDQDSQFSFELDKCGVPSLKVSYKI